MTAWTLGRLAIIALLATLCSAPLVRAEQPHPFAGDRVATVMTRNLSTGADFAPAAAATTPAQLFQAVATAYAQVQANNFPERADALAREIDQVKPDLIGLQEASLFRTVSPSNGPGSPATSVAYDYLQILIEKLTQRGLNYEVIGVLQTVDVEIPSGFPPTMDVRLTDRIAVLARADQKTADLKLSNVQTGTYGAFLSVPTLNGNGPPIQFRRGWISVDAKVRGKSFRFITTHLEPTAPPIQVAQTHELLSAPASTSLPVIIAADFNSPADGSGTATYGIMTGAGFTDAWREVHPADPGLTCCRAADLHLLGPALSERIDLVMTRGGLQALGADVLGASPADRTPSGLWSSDHAGVAVRLAVP